MKTEHAAVAAIIRKELKRLGITGTVKSRVGAVNVSTWNISPAVVRELESFCSRYEYGNGARDVDVPQVSAVLISTHFGDDLAERIWEYCRRTYDELAGAPGNYAAAPYIKIWQCYPDQLINRVYDGRVGDFWPAQLR
jgi:hypothetical protein